MEKYAKYQNILELTSKLKELISSEEDNLHVDFKLYIDYLNEFQHVIKQKLAAPPEKTISKTNIEAPATIDNNKSDINLKKDIKITQVPITTPLNEADSNKVVLKNGKAGEAYKCILEIAHSESLTSIQVYPESELERLGLSFNKADFSIGGKIPENISGDFSLKLTYSYQDYEDVIYNNLLSLTIMPDPWSLWKELEPAENLPFPKAHTKSFSCFAETLQKNIIAVSRRGRSHAHSGQFREDDFEIGFTEKGWCILTVADGAGSAEFSRKGSQLICELSTSLLTEALNNAHEELLTAIHAFILDENQRKTLYEQLYNLFGKVIIKILDRLNQEAEKQGSTERQFASTYLCTILKKTATKYFLASFWIGDGGIVLFNPEVEAPIVLGTPDGGEYSGQTRFLARSEVEANNIAQRIRFKVLDDFKALILMTDGITDPLFETDNNLSDNAVWIDRWQEDFEPILENKAIDMVTKEADLLEWANFKIPGNHDDRTIVIVY